MKPDLSAASPVNPERDCNILSDDILKSVFENVSDGVLLFDVNGNLLEINGEGLKLHGLESTDKTTLLNCPFRFANIYDTAHNELPLEQCPVNRLINGEAFNDFQCIIKVDEQGPEFRINYSGVPQFGKNGNFASGILFARKTASPDVKAGLIEDAFAQEEQLKELELYQQQLKADRELLHTVIDTIPVMVTIYDEKVNSFVMNRAFVEITGYTAEDVKKANIMELAYPDPEYREEILEYMQTKSSGFKDIVIRTREGRDIETSWANVGIPDGRQVGVGIDISERKRLERELINARERAEWENQVQYAFIQNMSHEVRTPMNSILGFTELLQKEIKEEKEAEFLKAISYNGRQLLRLINDIIDFSRLDNNQILLNKEKVNLDSFLKKIEYQAMIMKMNYNKRHLDVELTQPDKDFQVVLNTDPFRLQQVLVNLIGNAFKYTREGEVEFGYKIRESKHDVLFYVKDTGIGISEKDKNKVFKSFNRLHDTRSFEFRGTGLGLAICNQLVKLLGGEIGFDSEPGKGTTFYFSHPYLELKETENKHAVAFEEINRHIQEVSLPDLKDKVILIVEDDSFSYMMMYHMLEETKALILHADSGTKAVEIFGKYKTDLVFLDIRIPEMDGYEVIRKIHKINNRVPVIAQTANALPEDRKKMENAGFNSYITKPISRNTLYSVLDKYLAVKKVV